MVLPRGHAGRTRRYRERGWWPGVPLAEHFERFVRDRPSALAVLDERGRRLGRGALWREAERLGSELAAQGVAAGDVVLIFMPNRVEALVAMLAALRLGAVPANLPIRTDEDTLRYAAELCGARALVTVERHGRTETGELALSAASACSARLAVMVVAGDGTRRWAKGRPAPADRAKAGGRPPPVAGLDHLMFTSSTTGRPKAVMHTNDTLAALNVTFAERFGLGPDSPIFMPSPLGHSVGAIHGARLALHTGAPLILQDRWDPERALATVAAHQCRFTAAATPFLKDLVDAYWPVDAPEPKLAPMSWFLCGGAQVPAVAHGAGREGVPEHACHRAVGHDRGRAHDLHRRQPPREEAGNGGDRPSRARAPDHRRSRRTDAARRRGRARDARPGGVRRLLRPGFPCTNRC